MITRLAKLPKHLRLPLVNGEEILLVHGSPKDPYTPITHDMSAEEVVELIDDDHAQFIVCGGSHTPFRRDLAEHHLISVGSVGQAPEGNHAHLSILTPQMTGIQVEQLWLNYAS
ncbi:MAG: metallophosphoesterase [Myxococcales bacterium]|nr:MAG: metallophosphoesterase [Myxococcales bacterium]